MVAALIVSNFNRPAPLTREDRSCRLALYSSRVGNGVIDQPIKSTALWSIASV